MRSRPGQGDMGRRLVWSGPVVDPGNEAEELTQAVEGARRADEAAFDRIYRALHPGLLRYLRVLVGADAEDVASEAWLQIARDLDSFRGDWDRFRGWAVTIARHRAVDHARRRQRRPELAVAQVPERASPVNTADAALEAIDTDTAIALIAALPREQAEAILLRVVFALDAKSCGRILGRRAGTVRTAAHRGLRQLENLLDADRVMGAEPGEATAASGRRGRYTSARTTS